MMQPSHHQSSPTEQPVNVSPDELEDLELGSVHSKDSGDSRKDSEDIQHDDEEDEELQDGCVSKRTSCYLKFAVGLLLAGFIVFVIVDSVTNCYIKNAINDFLRWIEDNPVPGIFAFVLTYFVATIFFIPGSILTLGAGFVFAAAFGLGAGIVLGTISVFVGASLGAIASFLLGRYLLREQVTKLTRRYTIFEALDAALEQNGLKIFALLRLSPIIPFNVINYIGGVSSVSFRDYVIALLAILPGTTLYVFLGASAGSLTDSAKSDDNNVVTIVVIVVGAVFGIASILLTTRYAKRELNRILAERQEAMQAEAETDEPSTNDEESASTPPSRKPSEDSTTEDEEGSMQPSQGPV